MTDSKSPSSAALPAGEQEFHDWFAANYSGEVVFSDPRWHSEKILRWARRAALAAPRSPVPLTVAKIVSLGPRGTDDEAIRWARVIEAEHGIVPGPASTSPDPDVDPRGPDYRPGFGVSSMGWVQNGCRLVIRCTEPDVFLPAIHVSVYRVGPDAATAGQDGWKVAPLEPTPQMVDAAQQHAMREGDEEPHRARGEVIAIYKDMLAAAPAPALATMPASAISREEFITRYAAESGITRAEFDQQRIALPCDCGYEGCEGWAAVPRSVDRIMGHIAGTAESVFLDMRADLRKLKNKQNALRSFVEGVAVDKGADPALRQRATEALDAGDTPTHRLLGTTHMQGHLTHLLKVYAPIEKPEDPAKEGNL